MPPESVIQRSFAGGELAPALGARADQAKYLTGLAICRNFIVQRHGGVANRPGTRFVAATKNPADPVKLLTFIFEAADQTYVIEAGDTYFRFYWHGAPVVVDSVAAWDAGTTYALGDLVVDAAVNYYSLVDSNTGNTPASSPTFWYPLTGDIYEIPTPYAAEDVARLVAVQSADVLTLTHPSYAPLELHRLDHTTWTLVPFTTAPSILAPTSPSGIAGAAGTLTMRYVVTAVKSETFEESYASSVITIATCAAPTVTAPNTLSWTGSSGAGEYDVYCDPYGNGVYGFIGNATSTSFRDVGFTPDFTISPPTPRVLFASTDNYPSVATHYQQRLLFANSNDEREKVWGSQVGAYHNFSVSTPLQDDDAIEFVIAGDQLNPVAWLIGLKQLLVLTDAGEWVIRGDQQGVLKPTAINADQDGYVGADARVKPVIIGNAVVYVQALGGLVRDLRFELESQGFAGTDLTIFATHLFESYYTIQELAYAKQPNSIVWAVRSDGTLLGLTYLRDQEVAGWHRHDTLVGHFENVAVVPDRSIAEDVTYVVVRRVIDGDTVRYVERFMPRTVGIDGAPALFVDASLSYSGSPISTVTGLDHLEGEIVAVVGNGAVVFDGDATATNAESFRVSGGSITLTQAYASLHVGLPIQYAEIETLDLDVQGASIRDKKKRVGSVTLLVDGSSRGFKAGPDADHLFPDRREPWETVVAESTGAREVNITCSFDAPGRVRIRQTDPLPLTVLGVIPNVEIGG